MFSSSFFVKTAIRGKISRRLDNRHSLICTPLDTLWPRNDCVPLDTNGLLSIMQRPYFSRPTTGFIPVRPGLFKGVVNYFALAMAKQRTNSAKSSNGANLGFGQKLPKL